MAKGDSNKAYLADFAVCGERIRIRATQANREDLRSMRENRAYSAYSGRICEWITKIKLIQSISGNIKPIWAKLCEGVSK